MGPEGPDHLGQYCGSGMVGRCVAKIYCSWIGQLGWPCEMVRCGVGQV